MIQRLFTTLLVVLFIGGSLYAQSGHDIRFDIDGYKNDTLIIGFYYGKSQRVLDTLINEKRNGKFRLTGKDTLTQGTYLALIKPENNYFQFMVDSDQNFKLNNKVDDLNDVKVKGSDENDRFYDYLGFLKKMNGKVTSINKKYKNLNSETDSLKKLELMTALDIEVKKRQNQIVKENPSSLTSLLIKNDLSIDIPEFEGTDMEKKEQRYHYVKKHYFDHLDLTDDRNIGIPGFEKKITDYIDRWTPNYPDSIIVGIDNLLSKMWKAKETYKYFVSTFINKYGKSRIIGQDAIYVHLAKNYYGNGLAPWADKKTIGKILNEARMMEPSLMGKIAPNVTLFKEDSTAVTLHDVEARFTVLLFWSPTCGHCTKSMPDIIKFQEEYANKDVKLLAICTKRMEDYPKCWKSVKKQHMENFLNLGDKHGKSRFKLKFNVRTTPKIFVLNRDKKIVLKDFPTNKLGEVIDGLIKEEERLKTEERLDK